MLFTQMREFKLKPILTTSIDEIIMYLSDSNYNFEFILINNNDLYEKDILKIQRIKNSSIKIIILDVENLNDKIIMYDYKLLRPIDNEKINYLLGILYTSAQYQTKNIHNEILVEDKKIKIGNINNSTKKILEKSNLKILVAEDNKENQIVLVELLRSLGYFNIDIAEDGQETYMKLLDNDFHVVFMDLKMPIMSGINVTQKFKEIRNITTKIIAVTASLSDEVKTKCFEAKMDGFITKPIDKKDLNTVLNIILNSF
jgi:CheY-like chemotaxis protein